MFDTSLVSITYCSLTTPQVQIRKDYYKEYFAATEPMFVKPREFKVYNRLGSPYYTAKER